MQKPGGTVRRCLRACARGGGKKADELGLCVCVCVCVCMCESERVVREKVNARGQRMVTPYETSLHYTPSHYTLRTRTLKSAGVKYITPSLLL
jgi:hypothetical protein